MKAKSRISDLQNRLYPYRSILFLLFVIVIFHNSWIELLDKYIIPIVSQIPDNNIAIAACILALSAFTCYFNHKQLYKASYFISQTLLIEISALAIYLFLRYCSYYYFYGCWNIDYVLMSMAPFLLAELLRIFRVCKEKCQKQSVGDELSNNSFLIDTPCDDESLVKERGVYAEHLIQHIFGTFYSYKKNKSNSNPFTGNGAFVINIGEEYGYGKTSFFALLHKKLTESKKNQYISFSYQPWLCESENAMVTELFYRFREALSPYAPQVNKNIANYIRILLDKSDNVFVHFFKTVFFQSSSMHVEREKLKDTIAGLSKPIIVFIDDVDRLQKEELLMLLNLVRDTADFQNVFYIMAADKDHLTNCLEDCNITNPSKYLKKIINYEFLLPANDGIITTILQEKLTSILSKYIEKEDVLHRVVSSITNHENIKVVFCNIRDIKRILNDYMVILAVIKSNTRESKIDYKDLFLLTIIKAFRPEVYKLLRDNGEHLLCPSNDIYILDPKYSEVHNEELLATIRAAGKIANANNYDTANTNSNVTTKENECKTIDDVMMSFQQFNDEFVAHSLRYLFSSHRSPGDDINIKHKESYYRYFSGQLRKNQLTNLEVEQILCYDEEKFQKQIKIIFENHKTDSFITRMMEWSKKWRNSPIVFLRNICLFIEDDFRDEFSKSPYGLDKREFEDKFYYASRIKYSQILYNLYGEWATCKIDEAEKELLHRFLMEDAHYEFSARTLSSLLGQYPNIKVVEYDILVSWRRELIKQFIQNCLKDCQDPFKDEILDVIHVLRDGPFDSHYWDKEFADYLSNTSDYWVWFERLVTYEDGKFILNTKYIRQLDFFTVGNFMHIINNCTENIQQDERVKDLMSLIPFENLGDIKDIENHPSLLYIKNKYDSRK